MSPCPDGLQKKMAWDHWSPKNRKNHRAVEFGHDAVGSKGYNSAGFGRLSPKSPMLKAPIRGNGQAVRGRKELFSKETNKEIAKQVRDAEKDTKKGSLPVLPSKSIEPSPHKKKYPSILSVSIAGHGLDTKEEKAQLCYNCGKKGHWFVDCLVSCGHCAKNGHRTMDCVVVGAKSKAAVMKK